MTDSRPGSVKGTILSGSQPLEGKLESSPVESAEDTLGIITSSHVSKTLNVLGRESKVGVLELVSISHIDEISRKFEKGVLLVPVINKGSRPVGHAKIVLAVCPAGRKLPHYSKMLVPEVNCEAGYA
jgi:hypothetical protein